MLYIIQELAASVLAKIDVHHKTLPIANFNDSRQQNAAINIPALFYWLDPHFGIACIIRILTEIKNSKLFSPFTHYKSAHLKLSTLFEETQNEQ